MELTKHQTEQTDALASQLIKSAGGVKPKLLELREALIKKLDEALFPEAGDTARFDFISGEEVLLEVVDAQSSTLFRRRLSLHYEENANALRLVGEDLNAKPSEIAFLTEIGMLRLKELRGGGQNEPRCERH